MPRKRKLNKSQAIRDYLAKNPNANPKAIQAGLKAKGIAVSESLASAVKYSKKKGAGRPIARRPARAASAARKSVLRAEDLLEAKKFVDRVGGVGAARRAIEVLEQLG